MNISTSTTSPIVTTATQRTELTSVFSSSSPPIRQRMHAGLIPRSSHLQQQTVASSLPAMTTALGNVFVPSTLAGVQHPSSSAFTGISAATGTEQLPASFAALHQPSTTHAVNSVGERQHPASFVIASHPSNGAGVDIPAFSTFAYHPTQHAGYDPAYPSAAHHVSDLRFSHLTQHAGNDPDFPSAALHVTDTRHAPHSMQRAGYDPVLLPAFHPAFNVPPSSAVSQQHILSDIHRLHHAVQHAGYDPAHHSAAHHDFDMRYASHPLRHAGYDPAYPSAAHPVSDLRFSSRSTQYAGYDPAYPSTEHHASDPRFATHPMQLAGYDPADPSAALIARSVPASSDPPQHTPAALLRPHSVQHTGYDPGNLAADHEQHLPSALYSPHFKQPGHGSLSAADQTGILPATFTTPHHLRESSVPSSPQWNQQTGYDPGTSSAASVFGYDPRYVSTSTVTHPHRVAMASSSPHRLKLAGYTPSSYAVNQNGVLPPSSSAVSRRQWALRQARKAGFTPAFSSAALFDVHERYVPPVAVHQQPYAPTISSPHSAQPAGFTLGCSSATLQAGYDPASVADQHHMSAHRDFQFVQVAPDLLPSAIQQQPFLLASNSPPPVNQFRSQDPSVALHHSGSDPPIQPAIDPCPSHRFIVEPDSTSTTTGSAPAFIATGPQVSAHAAGFTPAPDLYSDSRRLPSVPNLLTDSANVDPFQRHLVNITANGAGMIPALSSMLRTLSVKSERDPCHHLTSTVNPDQGSTPAPATTRSLLTSTVYCRSGAPICAAIVDPLQSSSASGALHSDVNDGSQLHLHTAASSHFDPFAAAAARMVNCSSSAKTLPSFGFAQQPHTPSPSTIHRQAGFIPVSFATDPAASTSTSSQPQLLHSSFSNTDSRIGTQSTLPHHLGVNPADPSILLPPRYFAASLPNIEVEPFDGDALHFPMFISNFKTLIHDQLPTDALRMAALRTHLSEEVRQTIADALLDPSQYGFAIARLFEEYNHSYVLSDGYIDKMISLPSVNQKDPQSLKIFSGNLHGIVSALIHSGNGDQLNSTGTLKLLLSKLPDSLRVKWGVHAFNMSPQSPTISDLDNWLRRIVKSNQFASTFSSHADPSSPPSYHRPFDTTRRRRGSS